jgi:hypothetical protein
MEGVAHSDDGVDAGCGTRSRSRSSRRRPKSQNPFISIRPRLDEHPFTQPASAFATRLRPLQPTYSVPCPQQVTQSATPLMTLQQSFQPAHDFAVRQQFSRPQNEFTCQQGPFVAIQSQTQHDCSGLFTPHSPNNAASLQPRLAHEIVNYSPFPPPCYPQAPNYPRAYESQQRLPISPSIEQDSFFSEFLDGLSSTTPDVLQPWSAFDSLTLNASKEARHGSAPISVLESPANSGQTQSGSPSSSASSDMPSLENENLHLCSHDACEKRYKREGDLARHVKNVHKAPSAFLCHFPLCPRGVASHGFPRKDKLVDHLMSNKHGLARDEARVEATKHSAPRHK